MPGVSIRNAPFGRVRSWRCVVVCLPLVGSSDGARGKCAGSHELVDQRGFSDAGGAEKRDRPARKDVGKDRVRIAGKRRDRENFRPGCGGPHLRELVFRVLAQIRFGQDHHRLRAAVIRNGEIALQAAEVEILVERHAQKDRVDVCRDDLLLLCAAGSFPKKAAFARKQAADDCREAGFLPLGKDIVAHRRIVGDCLRFIAKFAGDGRLLHFRAAADLIQPFFLRDDSRAQLAHMHICLSGDKMSSRV